MVTIIINKTKYRVLDCKPVITMSYTRQREVFEGVRMSIRELTTKFSPCPPSRKKCDKVWGRKIVEQPIYDNVIVAMGWTDTKVIYDGKKYDMRQENEAELLYRRLSTDLALDGLN